MSLVKTVELRILADAGDAQSKLDEMDARAKDLSGSAIKMRFRLDDAKGAAQLDAIREKADRLGYKDVSIKVRVDGAGRAVAELAAVRHAEEKASGGGLLGKLGGLLSGGPFGGGGGMGSGLMSGPALMGIVPAAAAALVEVTGLVSGFAAAGAGAGAFYLLAHPAINNLTGDVKALDAANQKIGFAQQTEKIDPTKGHAKALHNAQVHYQAIYQQMGQDAGPAAAGMLKLHSAYTKMSTAFQPQVFKVFNDGLKIANHLLPAITPFANTFANSLDGLLKKADKFTQSKGFKQFLDQFQKISGPAVTAIGDGIGKVAGSIGKLLTTMSGKDDAKAIGMAFNTIAGAINMVASGVSKLMSNWDGMSSAARRNTHEVAAAFDALRHDIASAGHGIASTFDAIRHGAASMADGVVHTVGGLPGKIGHVFAGAGGWLVHAGAAIIGGLIHGLESRLGDLAGTLGKIGVFIAEHKGPLDYDRRLLVPHGQAIMGGLMGGIASRVPALESQLANVTGRIRAAAGTGGRGAAGSGGDINLHFNGLTTDQGTVRQLVQVMREYKRNGGGSALGLG